MTACEANFDDLAGPTHNYSGLSFGNIASGKNKAQGGKIHRSEALFRNSRLISSLTTRAKLSALILLQLADAALSDHWAERGDHAARRIHSGDATP